MRLNIWIWTQSSFMDGSFMGFNCYFEGSPSALDAVTQWGSSHGPTGRWQDEGVQIFLRDQHGLPGLVNIQKTMERSTIFMGKIYYELPFSIAMLNYQRVTPPGNLTCRTWAHGVWCGWSTIFCPFLSFWTWNHPFLVGDNLYPQYIHTKVISWFIPTNKYS
jgi:hypothetical protein